MRVEEKKEKENEKFFNIVKLYIRLLNSQRESFPIVMNSLVTKMKLSADKLDQFFKCYKIEETGENDESTISIPIKFYRNFRKLNDDVSKSMLAIELTPKNVVVSLVSIYDSLIGSLIKSIYTTKPELLNTCDKQYSTVDLLNFNSIEEIKEHIIEKEVETVLRKSHKDQFVWLSNKLNVKLTENLPHFKDFIEITERRNLFVHSNGVVSRQYISICKENKIEINEDTILGSTLAADHDYVQRCYNILFEIGFKLSQVIWRKINIGLKSCDKVLCDVTYDLIKNKQYELASDLLEFSTSKPIKHVDKETELVLCVNKALSYYLQGNKTKSDNIIKECDWSAYEYRYKLAEAVLLEDNEKASIVMKTIGKNEDFIENYREWPLFNKFRDTDKFKNTFKEIYGIEFQYEELENIKWKDIIDEAHKMIGVIENQIDEKDNKNSELELVIEDTIPENSDK